MTNKEIIIGEAILNNVFTEEQICEYMQTFGELPLHTFAAWKARGYAVKKGEKAKIATRLWKYKKGVKQNENGEDEENENCYLCKAFLFTAEQVERIA